MASTDDRSGESLFPGGVFGSHGYPPGMEFVADHAKGSRLWATDGREYIDYVIGSGPMIIGHAHPHVVEAIQRQAERGSHFYAMNETALRLAAEINRHVPAAQAVKLVADGAQATFYCMRLARAFTGRSKVLKFEGGYHGHQDYAVHGMVSPGGANQGSRKADSAGVPPGVSETVLIAPFNDLAAATSLALEHQEDLACIILEPVQRSVPPEPGFLEGLRALCDQIGALLIYDELVTGFRLAMGGAQTFFGVTPDLCALGKVIGGGLPLAAVAGRRDVLELSSPYRLDDGRSIFLSGTLNGNSLCSAAGLATLEVLEAQDGPARLVAAGERLAAGFIEHARRLSIPFQMLGPPAFAEPIFSERRIRNFADWNGTNHEASRQLSIELMKRGQHVLFVAKYYLSTAHSDADIDQTIVAAGEAMRVVRDGGYLENAA